MNLLKTIFIKHKLNIIVKTQKIVTDGSYSYDKKSIKREWVSNLEPVKFELEEFLCFKDRNEYLEHFMAII